METEREKGEGEVERGRAPRALPMPSCAPLLSARARFARVHTPSPAHLFQRLEPPVPAGPGLHVQDLLETFQGGVHARGPAPALLQRPLRAVVRVLDVRVLLRDLIVRVGEAVVCGWGDGGEVCEREEECVRERNATRGGWRVFLWGRATPGPNPRPTNSPSISSSDMVVERRVG